MLRVLPKMERPVPQAVVVISAKQALIHSPTAWVRADVIDNPEVFYTLSLEELSELHAAVATCAQYELPDITRPAFPLPTLSKTIANTVLPRITNGLGFCILKGVSPSDFSEAALRRLHWGLGLYCGKAKKQYGQWVLPIENRGYQFGEPGARNNNTSAKLWFHNDSCDITALLCVREAMEGGKTKLVSAVMLHNEMLQDYPEHLNALYQPYPRIHRHISGVFDKTQALLKPIFTREDGSFSCDISRPTIDRALKLDHVEALSSLRLDALDVLESLASDEALSCEFFLEPGDILYLNNRKLLHARTAFCDADEACKKRLLLRLHLDIESFGEERRDV